MTYEWLDNEVVERLLEDIRLVNRGGLYADTLSDAPMLANYKVAIGPAFALSGIVSGHPRLKDGREIVTSQLFYLNAELGIARTMNRWYRLSTRDQGKGY